MLYRFARRQILTPSTADSLLLKYSYTPKIIIPTQPHGTAFTVRATESVHDFEQKVTKTLGKNLSFSDVNQDAKANVKVAEINSKIHKIRFEGRTFKVYPEIRAVVGVRQSVSEQNREKVDEVLENNNSVGYSRALCLA